MRNYKTDCTARYNLEPLAVLIMLSPRNVFVTRLLETLRLFFNNRSTIE